MSENTIHSGNGTQRGVIIALVVLAIFVAGVAWLGNASAPQVGTIPADEAVPAATE